MSYVAFVFVLTISKQTLAGDKEPIYAPEPSALAPQDRIPLFSPSESKKAAKYPNSDFPSLQRLTANHSTRVP